MRFLNSARPTSSAATTPGQKSDRPDPKNYDAQVRCKNPPSLSIWRPSNTPPPIGPFFGVFETYVTGGLRAPYDIMGD